VNEDWHRRAGRIKNGFKLIEIEGNIFWGVQTMNSTQSGTGQASRLQFDPQLQALRDFLPSLLPLLEADMGGDASDGKSNGKSHYASIFVEKKSHLSYVANLLQSEVSEDVSLGLVLRIYDGYTLYECATDQLEPAALEKTALDFARRVAATAPQPGAVRRDACATPWAQRLQAQLEPDITSQIAADVTAQSQVHFGIRIEQDPRSISVEARLAGLKEILARIKARAAQHGLEQSDLSYILARQSMAEETSLFIDREVNMSQSLLRLGLTLLVMSGADRTYTRLGGLGGLETIAFDDSELDQLLIDLAALKKSQRIHPGKFRILISPGIAGVVAHEAFGHSQEGDTCARGRSKAWDLFKSGERVGNPQATILNNPAIFQNGADSFAAWGSYYFDQEGWLAQEQVLLDAGRLCAPMTNMTSALRLGVPRTANGKRESWSNGVYTRQTNTYFSAGKATFDELMQQLNDGYVATHMAGGMEDPKGMGIQVGIPFLKEVKDGKLTGRVFKGPAGGDIQMTGYTPDLLASIVNKSKIEYDSALADGVRHPVNEVGGCGKYHKEFVEAGCGGPWILLDQINLG
jgi:TldD protein